jgi:hypothetical protein
MRVLVGRRRSFEIDSSSTFVPGEESWEKMKTTDSGNERNQMGKTDESLQKRIHFRTGETTKD